MTLTEPSRHDQFWALSRRSQNFSRNQSSNISHKIVAPPKPVNRSIWLQEPKIPIQMNMSTLIRMKNNELKRTSESNAHEVGDRQVSTNMSCSPKSRGMFDYLKEKLETIHKDQPCNIEYSKNFLWKFMSTDESNISVSANPSGDGFLKNSTYHRVSAISVSDPRSGCNMQYVEKVSYESKTKPAAAKTNTEANYDQGDACDSIKIQNLNISNSSKSREKVVDFVENSVDTRRKKIKKQKKPVVVTFPRRTSIKYVKKY